MKRFERMGRFKHLACILVRYYVLDPDVAIRCGYVKTKNVKKLSRDNRPLNLKTDKK